MVPDTCYSGADYCVLAIYRDPDPVKKNGFSVGCDVVDCKTVNDPAYSGWKKRKDGMICRKSRDYGKFGELCCCDTPMCNNPSQAIQFIIVFVFVFFNILLL